jgi:hypothetical protein
VIGVREKTWSGLMLGFGVIGLFTSRNEILFQEAEWGLVDYSYAAAEEPVGDVP